MTMPTAGNKPFSVAVYCGSRHGGQPAYTAAAQALGIAIGHRGLQELHVVPTMHLRKQMMAERADAFIALPGGIGTLEELYEVWTWQQLGYHDQPIGLLNTSGYYDDLLRFMRHTVDEGFLSAERWNALQVGNDPEDMLNRLAAMATAARGADDYARI